MHIAYSQIGQRDGRPRVWLEGPRLSMSAFMAGNRFRLRLDEKDGSIVLEARPDGDRLVSKRERNGRVRPIIDIRGSAIERAFGSDGGRIKVVYKKREIRLSLHPLAVAQARREADFRARITAGKPLAVGSIFTGAGVIDAAIHAGLKAAGVSAAPALVADIDPEGLEVALTANPATMGASHSFEGSVDEMEIAFLPQLSVLAAGIPCVAASQAGRAKKCHLSMAEEDPKAGHLVVSTLAIVRATNPAVFVCENVVAYSNTASAAILRTQLERWGYKLFEMTLHGGDFGALESRKRWVLVAISAGLAPAALTVQAPANERKPRLGDIMENVPLDDPRWMEDAGLTAKVARASEKGNNFKEQLVTPDAESIGVIGAGYSKRRPTEPRIIHPVNPSLKRLLTPQEHAAAKGLSREMTAAVVNGRSPSEAHRLLGQSAIYPCFVALGQEIGTVLRTSCAATMPTANSNVLQMPARRRVVAAAPIGGEQLALAI